MPRPPWWHSFKHHWHYIREDRSRLRPGCNSPIATYNIFACCWCGKVKEKLDGGVWM